MLSALALGVLMTACLDGNESETIITDYSNPLITSVSLESNSNVCYNLSAYAFTVDHLGQSDTALIARCRSLWEVDKYSQMPGILFNPDSLPVGSIADSIKVKLGYSSPYDVKFFQYDENLNLLKKTNFADTQLIYFDDYAITRIQVTAKDRVTNKSYFMKVNVHQSAVDTILWKYAAKNLFDGMAEVKDQRVDTLGTTAFWLMSMENNAQTLRTADLCGDMTQWSEPVNLNSPVEIDLKTLYSWNDRFYAVGVNGNLLQSTDGCNWQLASTDFTFVNLLGVQLQGKKSDMHFCGIARDGEMLHFVRSVDGASWSKDELVVNGAKTSEVPATFPLTGFTKPISIAAKPGSGSANSHIYLTGGVRVDGSLTASTWCSDGEQWVEFKQNILPAQKCASVVRYTLDRSEPETFWIMQTGEMAGGYVSDTLFFSQNSGVTWKRLPREFYRYGDTYGIDPFGCSCGVMNPKTFRIYFVGGKNAAGEQQSNIVTGQLLKLAMKQKK